MCNLFVLHFGAHVPFDRKLIRAGTTVDQMVRAIADEILTGKMRPGDKLDEMSLAERYGVHAHPFAMRWVSSAP